MLQYTWNGDRLWRKNRRPGSPCDGVDLNRNYNDHWGGVSGHMTAIPLGILFTLQDGSSSNPCSETYHGSSAASEPETQNTANYFR